MPSGQGRQPRQGQGPGARLGQGRLELQNLAAAGRVQDVQEPTAVDRRVARYRQTGDVDRARSRKNIGTSE